MSEPAYGGGLLSLWIASSVTTISSIDLYTQVPGMRLENVGDVEEGRPEEEVRHECLRGKQVACR